MIFHPFYGSSLMVCVLLVLFVLNAFPFWCCRNVCDFGFSFCSYFLVFFFDKFTVNLLQFRTLKSFFLLFPNKTLVFKAGIHKTLVSIANSADPNQTASIEAV